MQYKVQVLLWGLYTEKGQEQLDTKGFKKILDIIRYEAEVPSVSFTGGEPTAYKDLTELIKYASKQKQNAGQPYHERNTG